MSGSSAQAGRADVGRRARTAGLAAMLASGVPCAYAQTAFVEEFDTLDGAVWMVSDGWANGPWQNCLFSSERVRVADGVLQLELRDAPLKDRAFSCGELQSRQTFGYGTYEVRLRAEQVSGTNANFFTYIGPVHKQKHNEIDFEFLGKRPGEVQLNYFLDAKGDHEVHVPTGGPVSDFRTYAFIWEPGRIRWFIDGALKHEERRPDVPAVPQKMYMSLWATDTLSDWMGAFRYPGHPLLQEVDWIAFTPLGEPCTFPKSTVCAGDAQTR